MANGRRALIILEARTEGEQSLRDMADQIDRVDIAAQGTRGELTRLTKGLPSRLDGLTRRYHELQRSQRNLTRVTSNANQVLFTAGDAVQDVGVAFQQGADTGQALGNAARFAGNNIAFGAEQIALLAATAQQQGITTMQALSQSLLGVGGVIVGIQLLVSVLPQLISLLSAGGRAFKRFREELEEIDVTTFADELSRLEESLSFEVADTQAFAGALEDQRAAIEENIQAVRNLQGAARGAFGAGGPTDEAVRRVAELLNVSEEQARANLTNQALARNTLAVLEDQGQSLDDLLRKREAINHNLEVAEQRQVRLEALQSAQDVLTANEAANRTRIVEVLGEELDLTEQQLQALNERELTEQRLHELVEQGILSEKEALSIFERRLELMQRAPEVDRLIGFDPDEAIKVIREWTRLIDTSDIGPQISGDPPDTGFLPDEDELDRRASQFARTLRSLQADWQLIQAEAEAGLLDPLGKAQAEVDNIRARLQAMLAADIDPADEGFQAWVERFREAQNELAKMALAMQAVSALSQGIGDQVGFAILGDPGRADRLREQQERLEERLARTDDPERRQQIQEDLQEINAELERFTTLQGRIQEGFSRLGDVARNVLRQMIADLTTAAARFALLSIFFPSSVPAGGIGGILASTIGLAHGGMVTGPSFAMVGEEASLSNPEVFMPLDRMSEFVGGGPMELSAEFRIRGGDLVAVTRQAENDNRRRGIG